MRSSQKRLAERVNACLFERLEVLPDKQADLLVALGAYHRALATLSTDGDCVFRDAPSSNPSRGALFARP